MKLDIPALLGSPKTRMLVPIFAGLFLLVRGLPAVIYIDVLSRRERIALALYSSTALPMVVVIAAIAVNAKMLSNEIATALIGAGLLSVLVFPILADIVLAKSDIFSKLEPQTAAAVENDRQIENVSNPQSIGTPRWRPIDGAQPYSI
jgi:Kef-type K+ transport system membrane component KefB